MEEQTIEKINNPNHVTGRELEVDSLNDLPVYDFNKPEPIPSLSPPEDELFGMPEHDHEGDLVSVEEGDEVPEKEVNKRETVRNSGEGNTIESRGNLTPEGYKLFSRINNLKTIYHNIQNLEDGEQKEIEKNYFDQVAGYYTGIKDNEEINMKLVEANILVDTEGPIYQGDQGIIQAHIPEQESEAVTLDMEEQFVNVVPDEVNSGREREENTRKKPEKVKKQKGLERKEVLHGENEKWKERTARKKEAEETGEEEKNKEIISEEKVLDLREEIAKSESVNVEKQQKNDIVNIKILRKEKELAEERQRREELLIKKQKRLKRLQANRRYYNKHSGDNNNRVEDGPKISVKEYIERNNRLELMRAILPRIKNAETEEVRQAAINRFNEEAGYNTGIVGNWKTFSNDDLNGLMEEVSKHKEVKGQETESTKEKLDVTENINKANSVDDLLHIIKNNYISIETDSQVYTPEILRGIVNNIRSKEWPVSMATGKNGFRAKLIELLEKESTLRLYEGEDSLVSYVAKLESQNNLSPGYRNLLEAIEGGDKDKTQQLLNIGVAEAKALVKIISENKLNLCNVADISMDGLLIILNAYNKGDAKDIVLTGLKTVDGRKELDFQTLDIISRIPSDKIFLSIDLSEQIKEYKKNKKEDSLEYNNEGDRPMVA